MIETTIKFCQVTFDTGNDIYRTMMKARKLSEGNTERIIVTVVQPDSVKTVNFINGNPV